MTEKKHQSRTVAILYGTETGNSQDLAEELGSVAERLHFTTIVSEMNNFQPVGICVSSFFFFFFCLISARLFCNESIHEQCIVLLTIYPHAPGVSCSLYRDNICYFDYGSRRSTSRYEDILEKITSKSTS